jgi:hypothetical protein
MPTELWIVYGFAALFLVALFVGGNPSGPADDDDEDDDEDDTDPYRTTGDPVGIAGLGAVGPYGLEPVAGQ